MRRTSVFEVGAIAADYADETKVTRAIAKVSSAEIGMMRTSIYIPRAVHDALREIAFHERLKVNELIVEGIDEVLAKRRQPSTAELKRKASSASA